MLQLTKRADYALIALTHLATHPGERFSARELAQSYALSQPLMANVLKALTKGEVIRSVRGTKGGYELLSDSGRLTVGHVVELLEGPFTLATCVGQEPSEHMRCEVSRVCPVKHSVFKIHLRIRDVLYGVCIEDLARGADLPGSKLPVARSVPAVCSNGSEA